MKRMRKQHRSLKLLLTLVMVLLVVVGLTGCGTALENVEDDADSAEIMLEEDQSAEEERLPSEQELMENDLEEAALDPAGSYTSKEDVALYLHLYRELPPNFITKSEAGDLGWQASKGNLWEVTNQKSIGGDRFGNREGLLPDGENRQYYECDINYEGGYRGAERIVYSNDGLVYYTPDHYESFELLYGEE